MTPLSRLLFLLWRNPQRFLLGTFLVLIGVGAVLLSLPFAHREDPVSLVDALFTSTSAVCVTGLIVKDTGQDFTLAGQVVILVLIQLGGLGIMTYADLILQIVGHRSSLRMQAAVQDGFFAKTAANAYGRRLRIIVASTLVFETLGAMLLYAMMRGAEGISRPGFDAVFHAVSAFCNAGFSTYDTSLIRWSDHLGVMVTIAFLIVAGGLGYAVWQELIRRSLLRQRGVLTKHWSLHTRVVLIMTGGLILAGVLALWALGIGEPGNEPARIGQALFMSITARTAGFNTLEVGLLPLPALLCVILLMFVGGSPGSCAGGVKTTSLAIWLARMWSRLTFREDVTLLGRRIPTRLARRAALLIGVTASFNAAGVMLLAITEASQGWGLEDLIFEQVSAFATVGLSTGLTPELSLVGKLWITFSMFVGRVGPLTVALAMMEPKSATHRLPEEEIMIG